MKQGGSGTKRWKHRPDGSNWGAFGADDQVGRLNMVTPEIRLKAFQEVKEGKVFCLSLPLDLPGGNALNPNRHPPRRGVVERESGLPSVNYPLSRSDPRFSDCSCDDYVTLFTQYSTQWDALSHVGQHFDADADGERERVYYNGFRADEHIVGPDAADGPAALALGIEKMAETCVQGRGVMIDLHGRFGSANKAVGYADLMAVMEEQGIRVEAGDFVCLHTGFSQAVVDMGGKPDAEGLRNSFTALDGRDGRLRQWIAESGLVALIADNYAVEVFPNEAPADVPCSALPLHELCLFKLGIHLGELWYLTELNAFLRSRERHRFLLTAPPLRLPGSFGSPVTPVASV